MSYVEQTWSQGDVITAEKLNHMESGIAESGGGSSSGGIYITTSYGAYNARRIDKTYGEIKEIFESGITPIVGLICQYSSDPGFEPYVDTWVPIVYMGSFIDTQGDYGEPGETVYYIAFDTNATAIQLVYGNASKYPIEDMG